MTHEWVQHEREGWSVCSRCGMVRNYDRDTQRTTIRTSRAVSANSSENANERPRLGLSDDPSGSYLQVPTKQNQRIFRADDQRTSVWRAIQRCSIHIPEAHKTFRTSQPFGRLSFPIRGAFVCADIGCESVLVQADRVPFGRAINQLPQGLEHLQMGRHRERNRNESVRRLIMKLAKLRESRAEIRGEHNYKYILLSFSCPPSTVDEKREWRNGRRRGLKIPCLLGVRVRIPPFAPESEKEEAIKMKLLIGLFAISCYQPPVSRIGPLTCSEWSSVFVEAYCDRVLECGFDSCFIVDSCDPDYWSIYTQEDAERCTKALHDLSCEHLDSLPEACGG